MIKYLHCWWKRLTRDYKIDIKNIKLVSPYILLINFKADNTPKYLVLHGDYRDIRTKYLKRLENNEIAFDEFMKEINFLIPTEDVVLDNIKSWKNKII